MESKPAKKVLSKHQLNKGLIACHLFNEKSGDSVEVVLPPPEEYKTDLTSEERAMEILDQIDCQDVNNRISIIEKALKEQDKITRHACAENIKNLKPADGHHHEPCLILKSEAQISVIKTKSI